MPWIFTFSIEPGIQGLFKNTPGGIAPGKMNRLLAQAGFDRLKQAFRQWVIENE